MDNNAPKPLSIKTKYVVATVAAALVASCAVWAMLKYDQPQKQPAVISKQINSDYTSTVIDHSAKEISVSLVYKPGCTHCENARKVIENTLSKNNQYPIQFTQVSVYSEQGQALQQQYGVKSTPLIIVSNNEKGKTYALNDGSTSAIDDFLSKYLIQPTKNQKVN